MACRSLCSMASRLTLSSIPALPASHHTTSLLVLTLAPSTPSLTHTRGKRSKPLALPAPHPSLWKDVEFPEVTHNKEDYIEARKLPEFPKVPLYTDWHRPGKPPKHMRRIINIRGPELIHNELIHKQFGIVAEQGGFLEHKHFEVLRNVLNKKLDFKRMFAQYRVDPLYQSWTKKSVGMKMGGGKGSVHHYVTPVKAERIIVEVGGHCTYEEVYKTLNGLAGVMPFKAKAVCHDHMVQDVQRQKRLEAANINPFTLEYCIKYNMTGCWQSMHYYDYVWKGKYT